MHQCIYNRNVKKIDTETKDKERRKNMTTVYLIRHAEAEGNLYRRAQGHYNSTITDRGYRQIAALAKRFADIPIDAVYSSDLARTCTTALAVTCPKKLPLHTSEQLREVGMGVWEDRTWAEITRTDREQLVLFNTDCGKWHVEGGQDIVSVRERMTAELARIIDAHPGQTVAVFSHGMALRMLIGTLQGLTLAEIDRTGHAENTAVAKLACSEDGIRVLYRDDASHLPPELLSLAHQAWTKDKEGLEAGIWFAPSGAEGHFDVLREGTVIGAVSVGKCENGVAEIEEYRLERGERGKGFGIQLIGQAVSYMRSRRCDTRRCEIAKSNAPGLKRAQQYGFTAVQETAESVVLTKYFGYNEEYRLKKLQEAIKLSGK